MRQFKTVEEAYDICTAEGNIIPLTDVDYAIIKASMCIVEEDILNAQDALTKKRWNSAYKTYYEVLHQLADPVTEKDWKEVALEFQLYINLFKKKLQDKIKK